jgi:hypothetical protein
LIVPNDLTNGVAVTYRSIALTIITPSSTQHVSALLSNSTLITVDRL